MSGLPLSGVKVVDLTRILSGPFCSMLLGDLGADVIKIEPLAGDPVRGQGVAPGGFSWYFAGFNRNKRSLALDLRDPRGIAVVERLIRDADLLVENFRPGILGKMGLTAERLAELNPALVTVSVNGYGSTGPYADRPAFDFITQAMSGFMATNGTPETGPLRAAPPISDLVAGLYAALAAVAALRQREAGGAAQAVEASMMMSMLSLLAYLSSNALATGRDPVPTGNDHPIAAPYGLFRAEDGHVAVAPSTEAIVTKFLTVIGLAHLQDEPRFAGVEQRLANRAELNALIDAAMSTAPQSVWIERLNAAGVPCGRVQSLTEALADPQTRAQEMVLEVDHPGHGAVGMTGFPMKFARTPLAVRHPAPDLGQHGAEVLREAGYDDADIGRLTQDGVVGPLG